jgi:hypothetical protein
MDVDPTIHKFLTMRFLDRLIGQEPSVSWDLAFSKSGNLEITELNLLFARMEAACAGER